MTIGTNKVNESRFQYARRGLASITLFSPICARWLQCGFENIAGFGFVGREPYSYIQRVEERYQFTDNFSWTLSDATTLSSGRILITLPLTATFTVNYGGVYNFSSLPATQLFLVSPRSYFLKTIRKRPACKRSAWGFPVRWCRALEIPKDSFSNKPLGVFWQDSFRARHNLTGLI